MGASGPPSMKKDTRGQAEFLQTQMAAQAQQPSTAQPPPAHVVIQCTLDGCRRWGKGDACNRFLVDNSATIVP